LAPLGKPLPLLYPPKLGIISILAPAQQPTHSVYNPLSSFLPSFSLSLSLSLSFLFKLPLAHIAQISKFLFLPNPYSSLLLSLSPTVSLYFLSSSGTFSFFLFLSLSLSLSFSIFFLSAFSSFGSYRQIALFCFLLRSDSFYSLSSSTFILWIVISISCEVYIGRKYQPFVCVGGKQSGCISNKITTLKVEIAKLTIKFKLVEMSKPKMK
jgi:hypothetical protein